MAGRPLLALLTIATLAFAGCLQGVTDGTEPSDLLAQSGLLAAPTQLWQDPQNAPHPAFGWPTLSNPATAADAVSVPAWWAPIPAAEVPASIAGMEHAAAAGDFVEAGAGIALFGSLAVVPGFGAPTAILDISDPAAPALLAEIEGSHRGAAIIAYPDARLVTVLATSREVEVWDITDPAKPEQLPTLEPERGSHKVGVVPGTPIVYNANSDGAGSDRMTPNGVIEIFDLSDPTAPVLVQNFENGYGCHHIYFWVSEEKQRALCAGIEMTQIFDIADPRAPVIVSEIPVHHGNPALPSTAVVPATFSHFSILNAAGNILIVGDETGGGVAMACGAEAMGKSTPTGALWFYDVSDEANPRLLTWISPSAPVSTPDPAAGPFGLLFSGGCTAHHGRLVPNEEGRDLLAMGYYAAGVVLVDFTDPEAPFIVDQWNDGTNTWEAWYYNGWLFTGDLNRGLDVLKLR